MNINKPMRWEEFKSLPKNMKLEYYNSIVDRFGVGSDRIAKMMGTKKNTILNFIQRTPDVHKAKKGGGGWDKYAWESFCAQDQREAIKEVKEEVKEETAYVVVPQATICPLASYHMTFTDVKDWTSIADVLMSIPMPKGAVVTIDVQRGVEV